MAKAISALSPSQNYLEGERVGVLKDFNFQSMYQPIKPMYLKIMDQWSAGRCYVYIHIFPEDKEQTLVYVRNCFAELYPDEYYRYNFMDDNYRNLYGNESIFSDRLLVLTVLSIGIACMGLLAFIAFFIEQNTKNIGVRKVMGATEFQIMGLLNGDILFCIFIGFLISCPVAYSIMIQWLSAFAYKTEIAWWIFAGAFLLMVGIALASVSLFTWRAATMNPVICLKDH